MDLDPAQHVRQSSPLPANLDLTPEDYFVLSRVEGPVKVGDLVRACGLPSDTASKIVVKLLQAGALEPCSARPSATIAAAPSSRGNDLRSAAQARRRKTLADVLRTGGRVPHNQPQAAPEPVPTRQVVREESSAEGTDALERIDRKKVGGDDPRVDPAGPIDPQRQRWILAMADGHESMSQFEILGILPTHDLKAIKRAFHDTSRALHPDAYHGRALGVFHPILASLFREAKAAYAELRREDVRAPWVDRRIEDDARARLELEAEATEAREAREAAAVVRRAERTRVRADRQRSVLQERMQAEAVSMLRAAETAEKDGNLAKAANLYLLARRADPGNDELTRKWAAVRAESREKRGASAYARAQQRLDLGQVAEALPWLLEAADAMPTAEHLAHAAFSVGQGDPNMARDLAMRALEALRSSEAAGDKRRPADAVRLHVWIGYAFLAAGQVSTAKHQVEQALALKSGDADVRALLKACKAK